MPNLSITFLYFLQALRENMFVFFKQIIYFLFTPTQSYCYNDKMLAHHLRSTNVYFTSFLLLEYQVLSLCLIYPF